MRQHPTARVFFASALAPATALPAASAFAQTPYDGLWQVTVMTKSGNCEPSTSSTLTVTDGKISAPGADVTGSIGRGGLVRVTIRGAYAHGPLRRNAGAGKWDGAPSGRARTRRRGSSPHYP